MHRFIFSSPDLLPGKIIIRDKKELHHIRDVLRLKEGEKAVVFNGAGEEYQVIFEYADMQKAVFKISEKPAAKANKHNQPFLAIACALPKDSRFDEIIDKLTQLGVDKIITLKTERTIVRIDEQKARLKLERWNKIALAASKQCQRNSLPVINPLTDLKKLLSESNDFDLKLIPTLGGSRTAMKKIFSQVKAQPRKILVLIGPEGDFSDGEVALAKKNGCIPVSLGDLVLRVETAVLAATSFIKLYYEDN